MRAALVAEPRPFSRRSPIVGLVAANVALLLRARDVVARVGRATYADPISGLAKSGPGAHVRHCLDVADCLLAGVATGRVDYTSRARDARTSEDPQAGVARLEATASALSGQSRTWDGSEPLVVRGEDAGDDGDAWASSSVERELGYLLTHTTHHLAIVALLLRLGGVDPGESFGVAPSTLAYMRARS